MKILKEYILKKYNIFNSIKETFIRFKNSIYYKNKYKKIFVKETMDKTIKEFFLVNLQL